MSIRQIDLHDTRKVYNTYSLTDPLVGNTCELKGWQRIVAAFDDIEFLVCRTDDQNLWEDKGPSYFMALACDGIDVAVTPLPARSTQEDEHFAIQKLLIYADKNALLLMNTFSRMIGKWPEFYGDWVWDKSKRNELESVFQEYQKHCHEIHRVEGMLLSLCVRNQDRLVFGNLELVPFLLKEASRISSHVDLTGDPAATITLNVYQPETDKWLKHLKDNPYPSMYPVPEVVL